MPVIEVYSRRGCHLCDIAVEQLLDWAGSRVLVEVRDVDTRDDWRDAYGLRVPVMVFEGAEVCHYKFDRAAVTEALADRV